MAALLNPLAAPKGLKQLCEICQKPAYLQCTRCRVTFYCCEEHQVEDWASIHEKICSIIALLRTPQPHTHSQEERASRQHQQQLRKQWVIEMCLKESRQFIHKSQFSMAVPAALEALHFLTQVYGSSAIQLTPSYLLLAEAAIGIGQLSQADQYLSQAQWSLIKAGDCDPALKSRLSRNLGLLAAAKGSYSEARRHFAEDIYQSSLAGGPEAVEASGGYYQLAQICLADREIDTAVSLHNQVLSIWNQHLSSVIRDKKSLGPSQSAEALSMFNGILKWRESVNRPRLMAPLYEAFALLFSATGESDKAVVYGEKALAIADSPTLRELIHNETM